MGSIPNPSLDEWKARVGEEEANRISSEATNRGTKIHSIFEDYMRGKEIIFPHPTIKDHFMQSKKYLDMFKVIYANEIPLYSRKLKVAGRCDCIAEINGEIHIVDFKTSKHFKDQDHIKGYQMQCSAYAFMANEMFNLNITKFVILISNLYENSSNMFFGNAKEHIKEFWEIRKAWTV